MYMKFELGRKTWTLSVQHGKISNNCKIASGVFIGAESKVENNVNIGVSTTILTNCKIGKNNFIKPKMLISKNIKPKSK